MLSPCEKGRPAPSSMAGVDIDQALLGAYEIAVSAVALAWSSTIDTADGARARLPNSPSISTSSAGGRSAKPSAILGLSTRSNN